MRTIISYEPLWKTLQEKGISQYYLLQNGLDNKTLDSLKKGKNITLLTLEKLFLLRVLERLPRAVGRIYTLLAVLLSFVLFQSERFSAALALLSEMFGAAGTALQSPAAVYALRSYGLLLLMGCIGATPLPKKLAARLGARRWGAGALRALTPAVLLLLLLLCTAYLADGSFNPFLYFRF